MVSTENDTRSISAHMVQTAISVIVSHHGASTVEAPAPACDWPRLCAPQPCRYPRYSRDGRPCGLVARVLIQLGYPQHLLEDLDREHSVGDVLHPGVVLIESRNAALSRIEASAMALLGFLQARQYQGHSWGHLCTLAFGPRWGFTFRDRRRRPWLY